MTTTHVLKSPYGVLQTDGARITGLSEKPEFSMQVSAGIYMLGARGISLLRSKFPNFVNANEFIQSAIDEGLFVRSQPVTGLWLDIGTKDALNQANNLLNGQEDA
jgi:NDP-sugar pyrophosphorylase family protein